MKLYLLFLIITIPELLFSSPEAKLVNSLQQPLKTAGKTDYSPSPLIIEYEKSHDQTIVRFANKLDKYINCDLSRKSDRRLFELIQQSHQYTPPEIGQALIKDINKGFSFKNGDIIFTLRHSFQSWQLAALMNDSYTHSAVIFIEKEEAFVLNLNINDNFYISTLADYIKQDEVNLSRIAIFRPVEKSFNQKKFAAVLNAFRENQHNIFFDRLMIFDTELKDPAEDLKKPHFYYCAEMVYAIYAYVYGSNEFSSGNFASLKEGIIHRKIGNKREEKSLLQIADRIIDQKNQKVIAPKTFTDSSLFKRIFLLGQDETIQLLLEKQSGKSFLKD